MNDSPPVDWFPHSISPPRLIKIMARSSVQGKMQLDIKRNHALLKSCPRVSQKFLSVAFVVIFPSGKRESLLYVAKTHRIMVKITRNDKIPRFQKTSRQTLHLSCVKIHSNTTDKIGCKTSRKMTFITLYSLKKKVLGELLLARFTYSYGFQKRRVSKKKETSRSNESP